MTTVPHQGLWIMARKYYKNQAEGFCEFLNEIGIAPSVQQCVQQQMRYLESKNAIGKWCVKKGICEIRA